MVSLVAQLPAEMLSQQIQNGLILLVLGMGVTFVFLTILVFSTKAISKLVRKLDSKQASAATVAAPAQSSNNDAEIAVAIAAAVSKKQGK